MVEHVEDAIATQYIGTFPYPIAPWPLAGTEGASGDIEILDIRNRDKNLDVASEIKSNLRGKEQNGARCLPYELLCNEQDSTRFEKTVAGQKDLVERHVDEIAMSLLPGTILIDLGTGSREKSKLLVEALESHHKIVDYFVQGLDRSKLEGAMENLDPARFNYVRCHGLLGDHEDVRTWVAKYENKQRPVCILSLGSTFSNTTREEVFAFWRAWSDLLTINNKFNSNNARVILGLDTSRGVGQSDGQHSRELLDDKTMNSVLKDVGSCLGNSVFEATDWEVQGEPDDAGKSYTQYLLPQNDLKLDDIQIKAGEKIVVAYNHRYDEIERDRLFQQSNLKELQRYVCDDGSSALHILAPC